MCSDLIKILEYNLFIFGYVSDMAVSDGAIEMMPEYTFGFGEVVKAFFGWVDDALVYIWE